MPKDHKGFTLTELLIVAAVIGILVAVSIPIFTSQLNKAKIATDQANIRSAKAAALAEYMDNPIAAVFYYDANKGKVSTVTTGITGYGESSSAVEGASGISNQNGTAYYLKIAVSIEGKAELSWIGHSFGNADDIQILYDAFTGQNHELDSASGMSLTEAMEAKLSESGINLTDLGAVSWSYSASRKQLLWTNKDISGISDTETIVIMKCKFDYPSKGQNTFTVWNGSIAQKKNPTTGKPYNYLVQSDPQITTDSDDKSDYQAILAIYNKQIGN